MVDQRSTALTLVAVFVALGLGLLIGGTMLGQGAVVSQQSQVIARLEVDSARLAEENRLFGARVTEADNDLRIYREFGRKALPRLLDGRLDARSLAIIVLDNDCLIDELVAAIRRAGGDVLSVTTLVDGFDLRPAERRRAAADHLGLGSLNNDELTMRLADLLARAVAGGSDGLAFLEDLGLIHRSGRYDRPARLVLIIGGSRDGGRNVLLVDDRLVAELTSQGTRVVYAERSDAQVSTVEVAQKRGVPTIDNLDTAPGQIAVVYALAGENGDFGQKATARQVVPDLGR